ncbi:MAG: hypothetical protein WD578_04205 [Bacteroidales bacterium]
MKTKNAAFLIALVVSWMTLPSLAQDLIILKSGDEIVSIVTEVDIQIVKYKKFENPNGPVYSIEKSQIFMIKYANGTKDVFHTDTTPQVQDQPGKVLPAETVVEKQMPQPLEYRSGIRMNGVTLSDVEIRSVLGKYPEPLNYYNQGNALKLVGGICQWSVIGVGIFTALKARPLDPPESELVAKRGVITMGGLVVGWLTFGSIGVAKHKQTVTSYNSVIKSPETYNFQFYLHNNQLGLAMRF